MENILNIAKKLNVDENKLEMYGKHKAKIKDLTFHEKGKLILVTSINPTKTGEGKTTVAIGLADALNFLDKNVCLALREPSLGPVFGLKGGATGGGKSSVVPSEDINLHFNGDFHAITSANNLLAAMIDNHVFQGNELDIQEVVFKRCMDMNDRALRDVEINLEKLKNNKPRKENFVITPASEIMAILCLAKSEVDLKERLGDIIVGFNSKNKPIYARDLHAEDAMAILLKDAIYPNLVQTMEGTPCIIHGGPFANIAHGCNSLIATKCALSYSDYVVTEAGFGADLGAEKFFDLKCRLGGLDPSVVVIVVTVKALKGHGSLEGGLENLSKHIENIEKVFNKDVVIAINKFANDDEKDISVIKDFCKNYPCVVCQPFDVGAKGCVELAKSVLKVSSDRKLKFAYKLEDDIQTKLDCIARKIYGANGVEFSSLAKRKLEKYNILGKNYAVIVAKTQYSLSDDEKLLGRPSNFLLHVNDLEIKNGAKFIVAICGKMTLMPGLPKVPNAEKMSFNDSSNFSL